MVSHFDCENSCLVEKNVPIAFILTSRGQDGAESPVERDHKLSMQIAYNHSSLKHTFQVLSSMPTKSDAFMNYGNAKVAHVIKTHFSYSKHESV